MDKRTQRDAQVLVKDYLANGLEYVKEICESEPKANIETVKLAARYLQSDEAFSSWAFVYVALLRRDMQAAQALAQELTPEQVGQAGGVDGIRQRITAYCKRAKIGVGDAGRQVYFDIVGSW